MTVPEVEERLNYSFKDKSLLTRALTLASADERCNNQTLEFFGDAILEFLVSEKIYDENISEGELTERRKAIVSDDALKPVSQKLGLDAALIKSPHDKNNKKAVPSVYEAVVAAVYLDGGIDAARALVLNTLDFSVKKAETNFKGELQELMQSKGKGCPKYENSNIGTPQCPFFRAEVTVYGKTFTGEAVKRQDAEQAAARAALEAVKKN